MLAILAQTAAATTSSGQTPLDFSYYAVLSGLLGIVEGLTEFLPVSSTAHLRLAEQISQIDLKSGYWEMYTEVIQLGAILSVPLLFKDRIIKLFRTYPKGEFRTKNWLTHPLALVMIAFVVTAGPCYYADKKIGENLSNPQVMATAMLVGGIVMWLADVLCRWPRVHKMEDMTILDSIWIGAVQILSAIFPGTSRSMSTIAAGQLFGLTRSTALEFSFFLAMPTMFAATIYKLAQDILGKKSAEDIANYSPPPGQWWILGIGFVVSFFVAWGVNAWFVQWVRKHGFIPFAIYRILLGGGWLTWWIMTPHQ